jgi:hypothetical protein
LRFSGASEALRRYAIMRAQNARREIRAMFPP